MIVLVVVAVVVVAVLAAATVALLLWLRGPLPRTAGTLAVSGLRAGATVVRDRDGFAHVDAASMEDCAFAMGLVHAQERLWQLDLTRRVASGRISEIAGAEGLTADRFLRCVGLRRVAEVEAERLDSEVLAMLEAYAGGVNAVIDSGAKLPLEFRLLRTRPERWRPVDSIACGKLLALGLSLNWDSEVQRLRLLRAVGPEVAARLELTYPESNPTILADTVRQAGATAGARLLAMYAEAARWLPVPAGASNAWAVAGSRTLTGRPMLCNDPHLQPSLPSVWFAAHVRARDDFESAGVTLAGQPFPIIGHNRRIAWGYTNSFADCQDLVIEQFDEPGANRYRTESGWAPSQIVREVIRVKDAADQAVDVVLTRHGPVVERCDDTQGGRWLGLALQWTALTPACAARTVLELQRARDWDEFRRAYRHLDAPSQNSVYADADGHIGYFCNARIPVRRRPASGLPQPGWDGTALWVRFLDTDEAPQALDPPDGIVVTANNRIVGDGFPHYIAADYMAGYRARRLRQLLDRDGLGADDMRAIQLDVLAPPATEVVRLLAAVRCQGTAAEQLRTRLCDWDARMDASRIEPTLYEAFMTRLAEHALRPLCGDAWTIAAGTDLDTPALGYPANLMGRTTPLLVERWVAGDESLFGGRTTWATVAAQALEDAVADLRRSLGGQRRWRWGRVHRLPLEHPLAVRRLLRPLLNAPSIRVGGGVDTVMATGRHRAHDFATRVFAPSWRQVIDVGNWEGGCTGILYPGQSGHRASRHHHDLSKRWAANRQVPIGWGEAAFSSGRRLQLVPADPGAGVRPTI